MSITSYLAQRTVMTSAHRIYKAMKQDHPHTSLGAIIKQCWRTWRAIKALQAGVVKLFFLSTSGELTTRVATRKNVLGPIKSADITTVSYYDLDKVADAKQSNPFGSFRIEGLIHWEPVD